MPACCVRRNKFTEQQVLTAFGNLDNEGIPCACPVEFPGPSAGNTNILRRNLALSRDGNVFVAAKSDFRNNEGVVTGAMYVFERFRSFGVCEKQKKRPFALRQILLPPREDQAPFLRYGNQVAVSADGNRIAVGAPSIETVSLDDQDAVYIYDRFPVHKNDKCGPKWHLVQRIKAQKFSDEQSSECGCREIVEDKAAVLFGFFLALSDNGRVLVVTSPQRVFTSIPENSVYIYEEVCLAFSPTSQSDPFRFVQRITVKEFNDVCDQPSTDPQSNPLALAIDATGERIAISAFSRLPEFDNGVVQVYRRKHQRSHWTFSQRLKSPTAFQFGIVIAMTADGKFLAVESPFTEQTDGSVTVYREICDKHATDGCRIKYVQDGQEIPARLGQDTDSFIVQQQLAISDDGCLLAIGWEDSAVSLHGFAGKVNIYERTCVGQNNDISIPSYTLKQELFANDPTTNDNFGRAVVLSGDGNTLAIDGELDGVQTYTNCK